MNAVLFCGLATAVGWGLRGEFGGPTGALIPGALLGLSISLTSCRSDWLRQAPVIGAAAALGMSLGGMMSYGRIIGYTRGIDMLNVSYGYAMLGVVGGLWGAFAAGSIAMAVSKKRYTLWPLAIFVVAVYLAGLTSHWLLVDLIGLRMTPPRGDGWANCLGYCLAMLVFAGVMRDFLVVRMMFWGLASGSMGFMIGETFQILGSELGPPYDWWKVMEQVFGFILGAGIAFGLRSETSTITRIRPPAPWQYALGVVVVAWFVPVVTFNEVMGKLTEHGFFSDAGAASMEVMVDDRILALLALTLFYVFWRIYAKWPRSDPRTTAVGLFFWVLWACILLGLFQKGTPEWGTSGVRVHNGFFIMTLVLSFWGLLDFLHDAGWYEERRSLKRWLPGWVAMYVVVVVVAAGLSISSHWGEWRNGAHVRFGEPPVAEEN